MKAGRLGLGKRGMATSFLVVVLTFAVTVFIAGALNGDANGSTQKVSPITEKCIADLAKRLNIKPQDIKIADKQSVSWPDTSLGLPEMDRVYAQVITPGARIILEARGVKYLYTAGAKAFRYGGPVALWSYSMLYLKPVKDEPNLNGNLYQCSLIGTNSFPLASGVSDFYPQEDGAVVFKRRTSRSSHELFYFKAAEPSKLTRLYGAFDFGEAAVKGAEWAGFVRPRVGADWCVVIGRIGGEASSENKMVIPLPEETKPDKIGWGEGELFIMVKKGENDLCFSFSPGLGKPEWKPASHYSFPGALKYVLNKSQSLDIDQSTTDGRPCVEVATVWFTGDRTTVAKIAGLKMKGSDLLGGRYAFIWGSEGDQTAAYTVDIMNGEVVLGLKGSTVQIKPFLFPPRKKPFK